MVIRIKPECSKAYYAEVPIDYDEDHDDTYENALMVEDWMEENGIIAETYDILDEEQSQEVRDLGLL